MKTLSALTTVFLLIIAFGAFAADRTSIPQATPAMDSNDPTLPSAGFTGLRVHPMAGEIEIIKKTMLAREDSLLTALTEAQTESQSNRIIQQITQLDVERELSILKVQMRFARLDGRLDLEREIRGLIASLVNTELAVLP